MRLSSETKIFAGIILVALLIVVIAVAFYSRPAKPVSKESLVTENSYTRGNKDAKVYLVEFSDFQCPACGTFKPIIDAVVEKNKDKLLFVYRHFPLAQHEFAKLAAEVSEAAGEQGKFWEMYDYLFTNQAEFSKEFFESSGEKIGLDLKKFEESVKTEKFKDIIARDVTAGQNLGVDSTPTFYLNGRKLNLFTAKDLETEVDKEIAKNN